MQLAKVRGRPGRPLPLTPSARANAAGPAKRRPAPGPQRPQAPPAADRPDRRGAMSEPPWAPTTPSRGRVRAARRPGPSTHDAPPPWPSPDVCALPGRTLSPARARGRTRPAPGHRRQRERLAAQRRECLRGDPHRRLLAGARVGDAAVAALEADQVAQRVPARPGGRGAGGHEALHRPGGRLRVGGAAVALAEAAVAVLRRAQVGDRAPRRPPAAPAGRGQRLQHGPRVVHVAVGSGHQPEAAVGGLRALQPGGRRAAATSRVSPAARRARMPNAVGATLPRHEPLARRRRTSSATRLRPREAGAARGPPRAAPGSSAPARRCRRSSRRASGRP